MLENIQFLRAIAASLVVMQHSFSRGQSYGFAALLLDPLEGFGLAGVDIFFVISGFIMAYSQSRAPKTARAFILGRLVRIVPLYWAWMALIIALIIIVPDVFRTLHIDLKHILYSTLFLSQAVLQDVPFIDLGWTLEYEMLFYIVFGLTLLPGIRRIQFFALGMAMLGFTLISGQWIILEFMLGVVAFLLQRQVRLLRAGMLLMATGIIGFIVMHFWFANGLRLLVWGIPSFLLVSGLSAMGGRNNRLLSYFGDASYSVYLVQVASIPLFYKLASGALNREQWGEMVSLGDLLIPGSIAFSLMAGVLLHEIVEKPLTRGLRRLLLQPRSGLARE